MTTQTQTVHETTNDNPTAPGGVLGTCCPAACFYTADPHWLSAFKADDIDRRSRDLVRALLTCLGFRHVKDATPGCVYDLSASKGGKRYSIEIKERNLKSTDFGDIFVEDIKQKYTLLHYDFDVSLAITVFRDNVIALADLYSEDAEHFVRWCPVSTYGSRELVQKACCSLPQACTFTYAYTDGQPTFKPIGIRPDIYGALGFA